MDAGSKDCCLDAQQARAGNRSGARRIPAAQEHRGFREGLARLEHVQNDFKPIRRNTIKLHPSAENDIKRRCGLTLPEQGYAFLIGARALVADQNFSASPMGMDLKKGVDFRIDQSAGFIICRKLTRVS